MEKESIQQLLRKRVIELKTDMPGFYTESYNIVSTLVRLTPAKESRAIELVQERIGSLYMHPSLRYPMTLSQFEDLYWKFKGDSTFKARGMRNLDIYEIKRALDKIRRDLLFYLALLDEPIRDYDIVLGAINQKDSADADERGTPSTTGAKGGASARQEGSGRGR